MRSSAFLVSLGLFAIFSAFSTPVVLADAVRDANGRTGEGYEMALSETPLLVPGEPVLVHGVAFRTSGLATLSLAPAGTPVRVRLVDQTDPNRGAPHTVAEGAAEVDRAGRFSLSVAAPPRALLRAMLVLEVGGERGRTFDVQVASGVPLAIDLLADRVLYERGETIHTWTRIRSRSTRAPVRSASVRIELRQGASTLASFDRTTDESGAVVIDVPIDAAWREGNYTLRAMAAPAGQTIEARPSYAVPVDRGFSIGRRTMERMLLETTLTREVVGPGESVTGTIHVRTPSGTPIRGATVTVEDGLSGAVLGFTTNAEGAVSATTNANGYLASDVVLTNWTVSIEHPAYGSKSVTVPYRVARVPVLVEARASNGALVPGARGEIFLSVTQPNGDPVANTTLKVAGSALGGRVREVTTDENGFASVDTVLSESFVVVPREGPCAGQASTVVDVTVQTSVPRSARACVRVAPDARLAVRAVEAVRAPGETLHFELSRRAGENDSVLIELLGEQNQVVAETWVEARESRGSVQIPNVFGVIRVRARPLSNFDARAPLTGRTRPLFGAGSVDAILVRPADAFSLSLRAEHERYAVGETAAVFVDASRAPSRGWVALVARDLAAHNGEQDWKLEYLDEALSLRGEGLTAERALRSALAARVTRDVVASGEPAIDTPPWGASERVPGPSTQLVSDPVLLGARLIRSTLREVLALLERTVSVRPPAEARHLLEARGSSYEFVPGMLEALASAGQSPRFRALGGGPLTLADVREVEPLARFDVLAKRVTRTRLVQLLGALARLTDASNLSAARRLEVEPVERWLALLAESGAVAPSALFDAWGRPFALRTTTRARFVLSDRAPNVELVSSGADGRFGTADDVSDPFARVLPKGSLLAIALGEDALMRRYAALAPGASTLRAMLDAFSALSVAAADEARGSVVISEESDMMADDSARMNRMAVPQAMPAPAMEASMLDSIGTIGHGSGGGGVGMGYGAGAALRGRASATSPPGGTDPAARSNGGRAALGSRFDAMDERVRERFPATLFFVGAAPLDGEHTRVAVPLADALTTYRVEAIAWSASGVTTSARTELAVDQDAVVDAPVPMIATKGDRIALPVRVSNRTNGVLRGEIVLSADGSLSLAAQAPVAIEVPANDAAYVVLDLALASVGEGRVTVRFVGENGRSIDAMSRPMRVRDALREVRVATSALVTGDVDATLELPANATSLEPSELRLLSPLAFFGDPATWGARTDGSWAAWLLRMLGREVDPALLQTITPMRDLMARGIWPPYQDPARQARMASALYADASASDEEIRAYLSQLASWVPPAADARRSQWTTNAGQVEVAANALLGLAPARRDRQTRPALAEAVSDLVTRLETIVTEGAVSDSISPETLALSAFALTEGAGGTNRERASELLRRLARRIVDVDDTSFVDVERGHSDVLARVASSMAAGLAQGSLSGREAAMRFLRDAITLRDDADRWEGPALALGTLLAVRLSPRSETPPRVLLDGVALTSREEHGVLVVTDTRLATAGRHTLRVEGAGEGVHIAEVALRYAVPWETPPVAELPMSLAFEGELGRVDTRSELELVLRNRASRVIARPVVEVELPAGAELDEDALAALTRLSTTPPVIEGRMLRLSLRPLAPGAKAKVELPIRWSVAGRLRGLGVVVYDLATSRRGASRSFAILPSREIEVTR